MISNSPPFSMRIVAPYDAAQVAIETTLAKFPAPFRTLLADERIVIRALGTAETYDSASPALRRLGTNIDRWPVPPAGLFVVAERTVYLRSLSPMTIAHETAHGIDCALGGGIYFSGIDPGIRWAFRNAAGYVTPYAAAGVDEYFAESVRAYLEINDSRSVWPEATRRRLELLDPAMYAIVQALAGDGP